MILTLFLSKNVPCVLFEIRNYIGCHVPQIIVPPVGKPWQQYQPPKSGYAQVGSIGTTGEPQLGFGGGGETSKRKPSILRRKSNAKRQAFQSNRYSRFSVHQDEVFVLQ